MFVGAGGATVAVGATVFDRIVAVGVGAAVVGYAEGYAEGFVDGDTSVTMPIVRGGAAVGGGPGIVCAAAATVSIVRKR